MPITLDTIRALDNGARFYTADLHLHSFGGSADVKDASMTVPNIVETAVKYGIQILAITDHNSVQNVQAALDYGTKYRDRLLILPAVEISTAHGHLLVYFPPEKVQAARDLLGQIKIKGDHGARESHTEQSMASVISETERMGGVCIAAHIDRKQTGFESLAGYPTWKKDILTSAGLYGVEVDSTTCLGWYSPDDEPTADGAERKKLFAAREKVPALTARSRLAAVQNSDAHTMADFVAQHTKRSLTRFKMNELSFDGFRTALVDPEARVRVLATVPPAVPRILGMQINGGFLDACTLHFSDNLNCIIGGRGTGKSTAIRSLAYALALQDEFADHENCPDNVVLYTEDEGGIKYRYERVRGHEPMVQAKEDRSITDVPVDAFRVEFYGQGDLAEVGKDPMQNPGKLQEFLDRHLRLDDLFEREETLVKELAENSAQLLPLETSATQLPDKQKTARELGKKIGIAEEGNLKEVAITQSRLAAEKALRTSLAGVQKVYSSGISLAGFKRVYDTLVAQAGTLTGDARTAPALQQAETIIEAANTQLDAEQRTLNVKLREFATQLQQELSRLDVQHRAMDQEINTKIAEFQKKGLSGDLKGLNDLIQQRTALTAEINRITGQQAELNRLREQRREFLKELADVRTELMTRRKAQLRIINDNLRKAIDEYNIFLHYEDSGIVDDFVDAVLDAMHGTFFQEESAQRFCEATTPAALAELVAAGAVARVSEIAAIGDNWANHLVRCFGIVVKRHALEVIAKPGKPVIKVLTRGSSPKEISAAGLSDGQKHTILLTIAMLAESNYPLIMDQPEDDLDNAFIFRSIVSTLRRIKERRQVILVTHNANIAVLGDSEILFPMRRSDNVGKINERGSIDRAETAKEARDILEGGDLAFRRRKEIYGY